MIRTVTTARRQRSRTLQQLCWTSVRYKSSEKLVASSIVSSNKGNVIAKQQHKSNGAHRVYQAATTALSNYEEEKDDLQVVEPKQPLLDILQRHKSASTNATEAAKEFWAESAHRMSVSMSELFLPKDYQSSVPSNYIPYAKWYFASSVVSSAAGVLSMQSLLYAIGLGAGSIPTAAAVNWVLKDGLGQFGGVLFAGFINNRYDADPKRWRFASSIALDAAILIELLTPLFPSYFLPMASLANVAKNISWLSASATRAGLHYAFATHENLADITAKAGSQSIAASVVGTGVGILLSQATGDATTSILVAFAALSGVHMITLYRSLSYVSLKTLNLQRLHLVLSAFVNEKTIPDIDHVCEQERYVSTLVGRTYTLYPKSNVQTEASLYDIAQGSMSKLSRLQSIFDQERYILSLTESNNNIQVRMAFEKDAMSRGIIAANLHAICAQRQLESKDQATDLWDILGSSYDESKDLLPELMAQLAASEWHEANVLVEEKSARYEWVKGPSC